jgi:integrase
VAKGGNPSVQRTSHEERRLREGARPELVQDNMGHANIDVTQNVYGKGWREERVDAVRGRRLLAG